MALELQKVAERSKPAIFEGFGLVENNVENVKWLIRRAQSARTRKNCGCEACPSDKWLEYKVLWVAGDGISFEYKGSLRFK
jgi:hypothetical protein